MSSKSSAESPVTLRDEDIGSERVVNRRSLLGVLGVGVAAGAILGTASNAVASDDSETKSDSDAEKKPEKKEKPAPKPDKMEETDTD